MSDSSNFSRKKITFNTSGDFKKKIDFSSLNVGGDVKTNGFNNNNQFTKHTFNFQKLNSSNNNFVNNKTEGTNNQVQATNSSNGFVNRNNGGQFRKPNLTFQSLDVDDNKQENNIKATQNRQVDGNNNDRTAGIQRSQFKPTSFNTSKQFFAKNNGGFNNQNSFEKKDKQFNGNYNNNNGNSQFKNNQNLGFGGYKKPFGNNAPFTKNAGGAGKFNFVKKDNKVKVKLNIDKNKSEKENVYRKTANTGGNIDKYSINSMIKGLSSGIEIDTEIDDVLGNVINVKPAGINSANSFQHERKVRTSSNNNVNRVNFNKQIVRDIEIHNNQITIGSFASQMAMSVKDLVRLLESNGVDIDDSEGNIENIVIDGDTAQLVAESLGNNIKRKNENDVENDFIQGITGKRKDIR